MDKAYPAHRGSHCCSRHRSIPTPHWSQQFCRRTGSSRLRQCRQLDSGLGDIARMSCHTHLWQEHVALALHSRRTYRRLHPCLVYGNGEFQQYQRHAYCRPTLIHAFHPRVSSRCHSRCDLHLLRISHRDHRRYVGPLFGGIRQRSEEEGDGVVSGLRRYRELHLWTIWLHPYHVFLSERGSCRLVQGNQPLHNRHRSGDTDIMRTIPTDRGIIGHYPAVRSRRLHFDDVRKHCLCELWHDGTLRILTTQHDYRQSLAKHRTWIHLRSRHVQDIPRHCQHRIRTKLRCSGLFVCRSAQPRPS